MARNKARGEENRPVRYRLKNSEPDFQVTREGRFEFHTFRHGEVYDEIPEEDRHRFETTEGGGEGE